MMPEARAIEASLDRAAEAAADLTPLVYRRLFDAHPDMEALFWADRNDQAKGEMLSRVISAILDFVGDRLFSATLIQCEVVTHEGYDVPPEVFGIFFRTLAQTVEAVIGADWTPEVAAAWSRVLDALDFYVTHPDQGETLVIGGVAG